MANNIQPEMIRTTKNQRERFAYALEQVVGKDHVRDGIGTLSEKTVHAVLKYYYEQDQSHHEIILEKSVADIFEFYFSLHIGENMSLAEIVLRLGVKNVKYAFGRSQRRLV